MRRRTFAREALTYPPTAVGMLTAVAAGYGDHDAVVSVDGDGQREAASYAELEARSADMASRLIAADVGIRTRVAILAPNGTDFAVAFLAVTRIGAVAVPINTFFPPRELGWVLRDADVEVLLAVESMIGQDVHGRIGAVVGDMAPCVQVLERHALPRLRHVLPLGRATRPWPSAWPDPVEADVRHAYEAVVTPSDDLVVVYTSGSTAHPKGVIHAHGPAITHANFLGHGHGWQLGDRVYMPLAFFWIGGLIVGLLGPLQTGAAVITHHRFEPGAVLALLEKERATYTVGLPHIGPALINHPDFADTDLAALRGGYQQGLLAPELRVEDASLLVATLGMTETCSSHTWWPPDEPLPEQKRGSVGVSAPGFGHRVVDDEGADVANGVMGELLVSGDAMMRGIVNRAVDEVLDGEGWYHTGDLAYLDGDGHIYFAGRIDDMIRVAGASVSPVEVEAYLCHLDGVRIAYVVGVPVQDRGAEVAAVVVLDEGATLTEFELAEACRSGLAAYKRPTTWTILPDSVALPYTTTDKVDKVRLRDMLVAGSFGR